MAEPVRAIQPEGPLPSWNLNCMGAGEEAPPRVHTGGKPVPVPEVLLSLLRRANTLRVLFQRLEVTRRRRIGQTAKPLPLPHLVLKAGSGTRASKWMGGGGKLACGVFGSHGNEG